MTGWLFAMPAAAQSLSVGTESPVVSGWTVGGLAWSGAAGNGVDSVSASGLHAKTRGPAGLTLSGLGDGAALRPWAASGGDSRGHGASGGTASGLLLDVPFGSFTFTPSVGAVQSDRVTLSGMPSLGLRSQVELGYQFDNSSRVALGFSRTSSLGANDDRDDDVVSLSVRLPFGSLLDW